MLNHKRNFEGRLLALHARGWAIGIAFAGMQRCGNSPVNSGALTTS